VTGKEELGPGLRLLAEGGLLGSGVGGLGDISNVIGAEVGGNGSATVLSKQGRKRISQRENR
jgi:hypothetical protein